MNNKRFYIIICALLVQVNILLPSQEKSKNPVIEHVDTADHVFLSAYNGTAICGKEEWWITISHSDAEKLKATPNGVAATCLYRYRSSPKTAIGLIIPADMVNELKRMNLSKPIYQPLVELESINTYTPENLLQLQTKLTKTEKALTAAALQTTKTIHDPSKIFQFFSMIFDFLKAYYSSIFYGKSI